MRGTLAHMFLFFASLAWSAEVAVVGLHVDRLTPAAAQEASDKVVEALAEGGKVKVIEPDALGKRIAGTEQYILDAYALGSARDRVKEAQVLYDRAELDQVVPLLDEVVEDLGVGLAYATNARDLRDALVLQGMALQGMGNADGARGAFRRAATLDVSAELDPVNYPPAVVALYEDVRTQLQALTPATLNVSASTEATVSLDGRTLGTAPIKGLELVPGEHYLLVRAPDGAASFNVLDVSAGQQVVRNELLERHGVGEAKADASGRSKQTKELYKAVGSYTKGTILLLAGTTPTGVAVQLYSPSSGNFSRALTSEAGDDPVAAICDLVPSVASFIGDNGDIRADKVSPQVVPLDIGANDTLARLLFEEKKPETIVIREGAKKGVPWWVWAGTGAVVAGGGAAVAVVLLTQEPETTDNGTITVGPVP